MSLIRKKSSGYKSISSFILRAVTNFDAKYDKRKVDIIIEASQQMKELERIMLLFSNNIHAIAMYCNRCTLLGIDDMEPLVEAAKFTGVSREVIDKLYSYTSAIRTQITLGK